MKIKSYGNKETEQFDKEGTLKKGCKWEGLKNIAARKLDFIKAAYTEDDMRSPPGNRYKKLDGNYKDYSSIRINDQWRLVFKINKENQLEDVQVIDYH